MWESNKAVSCHHCCFKVFIDGDATQDDRWGICTVLLNIGGTDWKLLVIAVYFVDLLDGSEKGSCF